MDGFLTCRRGNDSKTGRRVWRNHSTNALVMGLKLSGEWRRLEGFVAKSGSSFRARSEYRKFQRLYASEALEGVTLKIRGRLPSSSFESNESSRSFDFILQKRHRLPYFTITVEDNCSPQLDCTRMSALQLYPEFTEWICTKDY